MGAVRVEIKEIPWIYKEVAKMKTLKKNGKLLLGLFTVGLLALAITGGAIWAQEGDTQDDGAGKSKAARVAEILGLGEEEVQDAFKQAGKEMRDDRFQARMDRLVANGQMTEDEAAEAVEWFQSRPEGIGPGHRSSRLKSGGRHRFGSSFGSFGMHGAGEVAPGGY